MISKSVMRRTDLQKELPVESEFRDKQVFMYSGIKLILHNRCQCSVCLDIIESKTRHNFVQCKCGAIFTDGGKDYIRRGGDVPIIDLTEYAD